MKWDKNKPISRSCLSTDESKKAVSTAKMAKRSPPQATSGCCPAPSDRCCRFMDDSLKQSCKASWPYPSRAVPRRGPFSHQLRPLVTPAAWDAPFPAGALSLRLQQTIHLTVRFLCVPRGLRLQVIYGWFKGLALSHQFLLALFSV